MKTHFLPSTSMMYISSVLMTVLMSAAHFSPRVCTSPDGGVCASPRVCASPHECVCLPTHTRLSSPRKSPPKGGLPTSVCLPKSVTSPHERHISPRESPSISPRKSTATVHQQCFPFARAARAPVSFSPPAKGWPRALTGRVSACGFAGGAVVALRFPVASTCAADGWGCG